mmetsp:Transcript_3199/g.10590  ORF Transcript_3199/g.10590 Transcript_3199/m.10590 type:complete len:262 (+) Transcript_3199:158-943(+)
MNAAYTPARQLTSAAPGPRTVRNRMLRVPWRRPARAGRSRSPSRRPIDAQGRSAALYRRVSARNELGMPPRRFCAASTRPAPIAARRPARPHPRFLQPTAGRRVRRARSQGDPEARRDEVRAVLDLHLAGRVLHARVGLEIERCAALGGERGARGLPPGVAHHLVAVPVAEEHGHPLGRRRRLEAPGLGQVARHTQDAREGLLRALQAGVQRDGAPLGEAGEDHLARAPDERRLLGHEGLHRRLGLVNSLCGLVGAVRVKA